MTRVDRIGLHVTVATLLAFGAFALALASGRLFGVTSLLAAIFLAGCVGAAVNNFRHLRPMSRPDAALPEASPLQIYASLIVGGVLGFAIYAACVAGLVGGHLFPEVKGRELPFDSLDGFISAQGPKTNLDAAKSLLWAFIAGWFERTVPALLSPCLPTPPPTPSVGTGE